MNVSSLIEDYLYENNLFTGMFKLWISPNGYVSDIFDDGEHFFELIYDDKLKSQLSADIINMLELVIEHYELRTIPPFDVSNSPIDDDTYEDYQDKLFSRLDSKGWIRISGYKSGARIYLHVDLPSSKFKRNLRKGLEKKGLDHRSNVKLTLHYSGRKEEMDFKKLFLDY